MYYELKDYYAEERERLNCKEMLHRLHNMTKECATSTGEERFVMDIAVSLFDNCDTVRDAGKVLKKLEYIVEPSERRIVTLLVDICVYYY